VDLTFVWTAVCDRGGNRLRFKQDKHTAMETSQTNGEREEYGVDFTGNTT
jgi:hypothetical protein